MTHADGDSADEWPRVRTCKQNNTSTLNNISFTRLGLNSRCQIANTTKRCEGLYNINDLIELISNSSVYNIRQADNKYNESDGQKLTKNS